MGEAYALGESAVVVRCGTAARNAKRLYVLLDDDFEAAFEDEGLPQGYRQRLLAAWETSVMMTHDREVAAVVVPSPRLEQIHRSAGRRVIRMDPSWRIPSEFPGQEVSAGPFKVAFLGTRSHLADLELLHSAITDARRTWEFHHFLGKGAPAWLAGCRHVFAHKALPWKAYRHEIGRMRFHLCVYPTCETAVNAARSCNKIMEHAMTGAASLYSKNVPFRGQLSFLTERCLVSDEGWATIIAELQNDRRACHDLAKDSHALAVALASSARDQQVRIWGAIARGEAPF